MWPRKAKDSQLPPADCDEWVETTIGCHTLKVPGSLIAELATGSDYDRKQKSRALHRLAAFSVEQQMQPTLEHFQEAFGITQSEGRVPVVQARDLRTIY
jgi:hypothetical protein